MKQILLEISDDLYESLERAAKRDDRTIDGYIARQLRFLMYGHCIDMPPITDEELEAFRAERTRGVRLTLKAKDRNYVFERDGGKCRDCGGTILYNEVWHIDHLVPVKKGGGNELSNLALSCVRCNLEKGAK